MFKKALYLLILLWFTTQKVYSQYEDDAPKTNIGTDSSRKINLNNIKDNLNPGMEFMVNGSQGVFFAEVSPFVGYKPLKPIMVGAGVHGSILGAGGYGTYTYYGTYAFARLIIADQFFLHGEYRLLNGSLPGPVKNRVWVTSPIVGVGFMYGGQAYLLIGYAMNTQFQQINPFQGLVYRLGVYF